MKPTAQEARKKPAATKCNLDATGLKLAVKQKKKLGRRHQLYCDRGNKKKQAKTFQLKKEGFEKDETIRKERLEMAEYILQNGIKKIVETTCSKNNFLPVSSEELAETSADRSIMADALRRQTNQMKCLGWPKQRKTKRKAYDPIRTSNWQNMRNRRNTR